MAEKPKLDRLTINITGLREAIENFRKGDPSWEELDFQQKIRVLIRLGLQTEGKDINE